MNAAAITGIGVVSPFGVGKDAFATALKQGSRVVRSTIHEFNGVSREGFHAGLIEDLGQASKGLPRKLVKFMSAASLIGCLAGKEAAEEAAVRERFEPERIGIFSATGLTAANLDGTTQMLQASIDSEGEFSETLFGKVGLGLMNPLNSFKVLPNMPPCILSILLGIKGPNLIFNPWEGQTAASIYEGFKAVIEGDVDCALVGAADTASSPPTVIYLKQKRLIENDEFPSSAGAYIVFESLDRAKTGGGHIYGVLKDVEVINTRERPFDPLAENLGRTYAAAPILLLAAKCMGVDMRTRMIGTRGTAFSFSLQKY